MKRYLLALCLSLGWGCSHITSVPETIAVAPITVTVSPQSALVPARLLLTIHIRPNPDNLVACVYGDNLGQSCWTMDNRVPEYTRIWNVDTAGSYQIVALLYRNDGQILHSKPVTVLVGK